MHSCHDKKRHTSISSLMKKMTATASKAGLPCSCTDNYATWLTDLSFFPAHIFTYKASIIIKNILYRMHKPLVGNLCYR